MHPHTPGGRAVLAAVPSSFTNDLQRAGFLSSRRFLPAMAKLSLKSADTAAFLPQVTGGTYSIESLDLAAVGY